MFRSLYKTFQILQLLQQFLRYINESFHLSNNMKQKTAMELYELLDEKVLYPITIS